MTEPSPKRRSSRPALASRVVAAGASVAATVGLVGAMASGAGSAGASNEVTANEPPVPPRVVVVVRRVAPKVAKAPSATARPRIVRRYVRAAGTTAAPAPATTTKRS